MRRDPWLLIAAIAFFSLLFVALFGARIAPHEPIYYVVEHGRDPRPYDPGLVFPFGSDVLGRDLFSVVLAGAGATLAMVLLGGAARVAAGVLISLAGARFRTSRVAIDAIATFVSAVPATLVALLIINVFVRADTSPAIFVGALLVTGWAGPYRVLRAELDRLAMAPFTESATALGVGRLTVLVRHHLPHLVPLIAMNASQQIVASLVLLAEVGVLGRFVGAFRSINIAESLSLQITGPLNAALVTDLSDWGGLLANSSTRSVDSLWVTRWLFLVPGVAFAVAAVAVSAIGFALARRYARRNLFDDLRGRGTAAVAIVVVALVGLSAVVPDRYADAMSWATETRAALRPTDDTARAFAEAGLRPVASGFTIENATTKVVQTGPASTRVGGVTVDDAKDTTKNVRPLLYGLSGGGVVDAPVVFVSRGMSQVDYQPQQTSFFSPLDLGTAIKSFVDDYKSVDVRGKIVVLERFLGVASARDRLAGPDPITAIENALKRGPAAVLFIDPVLPNYVATIIPGQTAPGQALNPYGRAESSLRITDPSGTPVVILSLNAANRLLAPAGLSFTNDSGWLDIDSAETKTSAARDLHTTGHIEVPLERRSAVIRSVVGEVADTRADAPRIVVWCVRHLEQQSACGDVAAAVAREVASRRLPFVFVDFDPTLDPNATGRQIADALRPRRIGLIVVIDGLDGSALRFSSPFGDLIPAVDLYAQRAGARSLVTRSTTGIDNWSWPGIGAYVETRAVLVQGTGKSGDLRPDAAALLGYIAGRMSLGAEELPR